MSIGFLSIHLSTAANDNLSKKKYTEKTIHSTDVRLAYYHNIGYDEAIGGIDKYTYLPMCVNKLYTYYYYDENVFGE